ncbi:hypothetical protein BN1723_002482 [Verticillium longisporum]|uniref:Prion-inhibition and propagation HeLo domain-containing protein n=1 Tax=Verticillium longisporum TaxID=100787 RepID=A0A0G4L8J1_VERLO|nr:hypothetical protein BN1723_002482 [Verticillium longisporum]
MGAARAQATWQQVAVVLGAAVGAAAQQLRRRARFEEMAGRQEASGFAIKQHVSKSIRSLWQLSQASGIDREDFERLVQNELDLAHMTQDS